MELTERLKAGIKRLNNISSLQIIEVETVEELEELLPSLENEADAIVCVLQELSSAINITKTK